MTKNNSVASNFNPTKERLLFVALLLSSIVIMFAMSHYAVAGSDTTFDSWTTELTNYMTGSLGKGVAIAFVMVGIIMGITRQSLMAIAIGVGAALGLNYAPAIITGMFSFAM